MEFFLNFRLNQFQNCPIQIKKMKDGMFSFQLKKNFFYRTLTNDARHKNLPPLLGLTRILKSYHKRNDRSHTMKGIAEENFRKNWSDQYHVREIARLDWSKTAKHFSVNSRRKFLSWYEASKRILVFSPQRDTSYSFGQLFQWYMLYFSSWANVY